MKEGHPWAQANGLSAGGLLTPDTPSLGEVEPIYLTAGGETHSRALLFSCQDLGAPRCFH